MTTTVLGIPTCGTVKKARKWLDEKEIPYQWRDIREFPPTKEELERWIGKFGSKPMRNTSGGAYRSLGPEKKEWGDSEWLAAFSNEAMLLKRPVLLVDDEPALVGFKVEQYEAVFGG